MDAKSLEIPFLSNIVFILTYRCPIACPHCIVEAGPHRKEEMRLEDAVHWIEQARLYRGGYIKGLALTGGEPFYNLDHLARVSEYGCSLGFAVSAVTSAFWATTRTAALETLSRFPAIQMISFSTDVYHQKAIPFENVKNAVWAAKELGCIYNIAVCTDSVENEQYQKIIEELKAVGEGDNIRLSITFPVGRAKKRARFFNYRISPEPTVSACPMASSPVIFPDGNVIACIGPLLTLPSSNPLFLGNLRTEALSEILDRSELNSALHTVRVWGPQKLVTLLKQSGFEQLLPTEYIEDSICDVCYKLWSDERIVNALRPALQGEEITQTLAYARLYYLNETTMLERCIMNRESRAEPEDTSTL